MRSNPDTLEQASSRAAFFIPGFVIAVWAPIVPYARIRAGLDDATLGMVLLCLGLGSLAAMPLAGMLAARHGCRPVMITGVALMLATLPLLAIVSSPWLLAASLLAFGAAIGAMDCAMNIQAVAVEREAGRPMMSGFHAFYSIGSLAGAAGAALLLTTGTSALAVTLVAVVAAALIAAPASRAWRRSRAAPDAHTFVMPRGVVVAIGAVCFISFLAEGAMLDWSAVFMHEVRQVHVSRAGWGFVAFNLAMTLARLAGDRTMASLGRTRTLLAGGLIASAGLVLATLAPGFVAMLAGYALVGMGCANIVPAMFTLAGRQTRMPESMAIPAVATMGYTGVLLGPALIGFVAHGSSLTVAFLLVAVAVLAAAAVGAAVRTR